MYFHWIVFTLLIVAGGVFAQLQRQDDQTAHFASLDSLSRGILVYRSAAAEYARANPSFSGFPADSVLSLPAWYNKPAGVSAYLTGGSSFTFYADATPGLPAALVERTESVVIGIKRDGNLVSPSSGTINVIVPPSIPDGAVVAVN